MMPEAGGMHGLQTLAWYPTLRCQLRCAYCNSRSLPHRTHGSEVPCEEWVRVFRECPVPVGMLMVTGGEPGVYPGLRRVLDAVPWTIHVNSNLMSDPDEWLSPAAAPRAHCISTACHFDPDDPRAEVYWRRLRRLRERLPSSVYVNAGIMETQQTPRARLERALERVRECGASYTAREVSYYWSYRDAVPLREMAADCTGGATMLALMPDGTAFRCLGHAYACAELQALGNVLRDGWGILRQSATPCDFCCCTMVAECDTVHIARRGGTGEIRPLHPEEPCGSTWGVGVARSPAT